MGDLLFPIALGQAGVLAVVVGGLLGRAATAGLRRRREHPARTAASRALAAAIDGGVDIDEATVALLRLRPDSRIALVAQFAEVVVGNGRATLQTIAARVGIVDRAHGWARSRRWSGRLRGARLLSLLGTGDETMRSLLFDRHPEVRSQAAESAALRGDQDAIPALVAMLGADGICGHAAKDALIRIGRPAAPRLKSCLREGDGQALEAALEVAAALADPVLLQPALGITRNGNPALRQRAAAVLAGLGGPTAVDALHELLADPDPATRAAAAEGLGRLGQWRLAADLGSLLHDPAWAVRRAAALALRTLGAPGVLLLRRARQDPDRFARDIARQTLELRNADVRPVAA